MLPDMGLNTPMISFWLCCQNACCFAIFNHGRGGFRAPHFLAPTEFMVGNSLGITIGATLLAMVLSNYFRNLSRCHSENLISEYICRDAGAKRTVGSVAFWSGLVFWLEFCLTLLIAVGRNDIIVRTSNYQDLSVDDHDENFRHYAQQQQQQQSAVGGSIMGTFASALPTPSFVGNYTSVPEIFSNASNDNSSTSGQAQPVATSHTPLGNV